jgi:lactate dehydrogenase-like 2-hydroxyacid dehydrogenase
MKPTALQLCPFSPYLEENLAERLGLIRWFELGDADKRAWLADNAKTVEAVITGGHIGCPSSLMEALPSLGIVAINGVGFDKVDLDLARGRGVRVTTTPDVLTEDVADLAAGLIIALLRQIPAAEAHVRSGSWAHGDMPLARKVSGRRFGIVGLGRIGSAIAARLEPFGPVAYTDLAPKPVDHQFHADVRTLARWADILVLASSATASTRHLIDSTVLEALGPEGYLVNVARGSLVDEKALIKALQDSRLGGAALDVFENEPNVPEALRKSDRVIVTPHIASATRETRNVMADLVVANLDAFLAGARLPTAVA